MGRFGVAFSFPHGAEDGCCARTLPTPGMGATATPRRAAVADTNHPLSHAARWVRISAARGRYPRGFSSGCYAALCWSAMRHCAGGGSEPQSLWLCSLSRHWSAVSVREALPQLLQPRGMLLGVGVADLLLELHTDLHRLR